MTNLENQYLKELAIKSGASIASDRFDLARDSSDLVFNANQLQAFHDAISAHYLSERNECVEEIRRLRDCFQEIEYKTDINGDYYLADDFEKAAKTSPTIERLLKESK